MLVTGCSRQRVDPGQPWPRAAVFDCDGLLVDSARCWEHAYRAVSRAHGRPFDGIDLMALSGASVATAARRLSREFGSRVEAAQLRRALADGFEAHPPPELPGVGALIAALAERLPLAVASNAPREIVLAVLRRLGVGDRFDVVVSAEQTPAHKPAPDVYIEACRQLEVASTDAIAFEDSPIGARAARAAGLVVIGVPSVVGMRIDADLTVPRLDDPSLLDYLGLAPERSPK